MDTYTSLRSKDLRSFTIGCLNTVRKGVCIQWVPNESMCHSKGGGAMGDFNKKKPKQQIQLPPITKMIDYYQPSKTTMLNLYYLFYNLALNPARRDFNFLISSVSCTPAGDQESNSSCRDASSPRNEGCLSLKSGQLSKV